MIGQPTVLGVAAALFGGVAVSLQAAALATAGRSAGALRAGLATYAAGGLVAVLLLAVTGVTPAAGSPAPRASWIGAIAAGLLGLVIVSTIAYATSRVSVAAGLGVMLVGQMATALVLDAAGTGVPAVAIDARRLLGLLVMGLAAWLLLPRPA